MANGQTLNAFARDLPKAEQDTKRNGLAEVFSDGTGFLSVPDFFRVVPVQRPVATSQN